MQSGQMKIVKDGDTVHVMPEIENMGKAFDEFAIESDTVIKNLRQKELETAIKKQADVLKFLTEMLHGE